MSTGKTLLTGSALLGGRAARVFVFVLAAMALLSEAAWAEGAFSQYAEKLRAMGDRYFKAGDYPTAIESYRCAVLEQPTNGHNKLAMGHALFARGNYSYAAYALRRGIRSFDTPDDLKNTVNMYEYLFAVPMESAKRPAEIGWDGRDGDGEEPGCLKVGRLNSGDRL